MRTIIQLFTVLFLSITTFNYAEVININTADSHLITQKLKGIGPVKADAIVEYREKNGNFTQISDLLNVAGIGAKTLEQIKDQVIFKETIDEEP